MIKKLKRYKTGLPNSNRDRLGKHNFHVVFDWNPFILGGNFFNRQIMVWKVRYRHKFLPTWKYFLSSKKKKWCILRNTPKIGAILVHFSKSIYIGSEFRLKVRVETLIQNPTSFLYYFLCVNFEFLLQKKPCMEPKQLKRSLYQPWALNKDHIGIMPFIFFFFNWNVPNEEILYELAVPDPMQTGPECARCYNHPVVY